MSLTKKERDALPPEHFAVPETRQLPIHDAKHTKMAWDMVDQTKGLSDVQRRSARRRILSRAKELGIDTADWNKVKAMRWSCGTLEAMSLAVPDVPDHPNRVPFTGVLTRIDEPSDASPNGAFGRRVMLPRAAAEAALASLLGMAIDYTPKLDGHDRQSKIGVITAATIEGNAIVIGGFLYASDFPVEIARIRADKEILGFSFEAERIRVESMEADPLVITECVFTGAAVLQKAKAAYTSTSLAASAEDAEITEMDLEELKKLIEGVGTQVTTLAAQVAEIKKAPAKVEAGSVAHLVKPHADRLHQVADDMEAAGIGAHPSRGHAAVLRHMADSMMAEAHSGKTPNIYGGVSGYYDASRDRRFDASAALKEAVEAATEETNKKVGAIDKAIADITTTLKDLGAKVSAAASAPERKTLPPRITSLMAKGNLAVPQGDDKLSVTAIDTALKGTSLSPQERIEVKLGLERAGLMAA